MDRFACFAPLGLRRNLVLDCLGGHTPQAPGFLDPDPAVSIFAAFHRHIYELAHQPAFASDPMTALLLAAGRLLTGDLMAADPILDRLPIAAPELRFGQRYCPLLPVRTLSAALPLPRELDDSDRWLVETAQVTAVRVWLSAHRGALQWVETNGKYVLPA